MRTWGLGGKKSTKKNPQQTKQNKNNNKLETMTALRKQKLTDHCYTVSEFSILIHRSQSRSGHTWENAGPFLEQQGLQLPCVSVTGLHYKQVGIILVLPLYFKKSASELWVWIMETLIRSALVFTLFSVVKTIGIHIYGVQLSEFEPLSQDIFPDM